MYVNVGVKYVENGKDIPTKKALKELLKDAPEQVIFYETSMHGKQHEGDFTGAELRAGLKYSVCGPNPFRDRRWYATVYKTSDGKIQVM